MSRPKFRIIKDAILYELYLIVAERGFEGHDLNQISENLFDGKILSSYLGRACQDLISANLISEEYEEMSESHYYAITSKGIIHVEDKLDIYASDIAIYARRGKAWLFQDPSLESETVSIETKSSKEIETDVWEPLAIDRTTSEYKNAVEALDHAAEKIEADNGYAASQPEERNNVVWSLKQGITALKEMAPSLAQVRALIIAPLNSAIKTLKESVPGVAAMVAREVIKEWIKSLFR